MKWKWYRHSHLTLSKKANKHISQDIRTTRFNSTRDLYSVVRPGSEEADPWAALKQRWINDNRCSYRFTWSKRKFVLKKKNVRRPTKQEEFIIYPFFPSHFHTRVIFLREENQTSGLFVCGHMLGESGCPVTVTLETALLSASLIDSSSFRIAPRVGCSENCFLWHTVRQSKQPEWFESESHLYVSFGCEMRLLRGAQVFQRHGTLSVWQVHFLELPNICSCIFKNPGELLY